MSDVLLTIPEIDSRIAVIRENLRELIDLATAYAMDDNLTAQRIADEEARLALLIKRRDDLFEKLSTTRGEPK